jgi:NAD(P)-dependent dehydrogenase (short-subunit alcohol dehydrogenase family)
LAISLRYGTLAEYREAAALDPNSRSPASLSRDHEWVRMAGSQPPRNRYGDKLVGRRILVLGGTSGIGMAVAQAAVEFGARVIVSSSNQSKIDVAVQKIEASFAHESSASVGGFACDLHDLGKLETNLRALFDHATDGGQNKLNHVVYTAGNKVGSIALADTDTELITEHGILRFYVPIIIGKLAQTYVHSNHQSSIIFTSGVNTVKPVPGRALMAGWGAGVEGVTRALAVDLRPVRVNCVCPGPTKTELFSGFPDEVLQPLLQKYSSSTMTRTIASPEDIAEAYLYCMRDYFIDGSVIHSSGGYLLA